LKLPFSFFLALRYLKPKRTFLSIITLISIIGVTLGVTVLILVIAVMTGFVGLVLAMGWIFVQPFRDHVRTAPDRVDPALNMLFVQTWLFCLYLCGFESEIFNNGSVVWFMTAASIVGLRLQAITEYAAEPG